MKGKVGGKEGREERGEDIPRSTARKSPVSSPVGQPKTYVGIIGCNAHKKKIDWSTTLITANVVATSPAPHSNQTRSAQHNHNGMNTVARTPK